MNNDILILNKKQEILLKTLFLFSCPFLTILFSNRYSDRDILIGAFGSLVVAIFLSIKYLKNIKINRKIALISMIVALFTNGILMNFGKENIDLMHTLFENIFSISIKHVDLRKILATLAIPGMVVFIYLFFVKIIPKVVDFIKSMTSIEKKYFKIILWIGAISAIGISCITTVFTKPYDKNGLQIYDVIYTSDTGVLTYENAYFNVSFIENDIRQPLFGFFALPFAIVAKIASPLLYFVPTNFAYETILVFIQFALLAIITIMLGRMMNISEKDKVYLYLFFWLSFPYLLFSLVLEQYVIGLFYLILTLYLYSQDKLKINYLYVSAVGTMLTSGIIFPVITKFKNIKQWITDILKCFFAFMSAMTLSGQLPQILTAPQTIKSLTTTFAGTVGWHEKIYQFFNFVKSTLFAPLGHTEIRLGHPSYFLNPVLNISILGILLFGITIISFIINRKEKMTKISFSWVLFSILILLIIGWGTSENGLILYSLYFSWAYICLYFLFIRKTLKNNGIFKIVILVLLIIMLIYNVQELINIIRFGVKYYGIVG